MILVTGATGTVGGLVVKCLTETGVAFRVMARDTAKARRLGAELDVVHGDFEDPASLGRALQGVDTVFLLSSPGPDAAAHDLAVVQAATRSGAKKLVKLSGASVTSDSTVGSWHRPGEAAVQASGLAWTLLRPVTFASNAL